MKYFIANFVLTIDNFTVFGILSVDLIIYQMFILGDILRDISTV